MFVPIMTQSGVRSGPGPEALYYRKWLIGAIGLLLATSILQLFLPIGASNIDGGVFGLLDSILGVYCVRNETVDMSAIMMFGFLSVSLSLGSLIRVLNVIINGGGIANVHFIYPLALLSSAIIVWLCWKIFHADADPSSRPSGRPSVSYGSTGSQNFAAFSGSGQRLGAKE